MTTINNNLDIIDTLQSGDTFEIEFKGFTFTATASQINQPSGFFQFIVNKPEFEQNVVIFTQYRPVGIFRNHSWGHFTLEQFKEVVKSGAYCVV